MRDPTAPSRDIAAPAPRPVPVATVETRPFWAAALAGELQLPRCVACDRLYYPPPPRCPSCLGDRLAWTRLSGGGRLAAWTTVHLATLPGVAPPFVLAEVELAEQPGLILSALLVGAPAQRLRIGTAVEVTFSHAGPGEAAYPQVRVVGDAAGAAP